MNLQRFAFVHEGDRTGGVARGNEGEGFPEEGPTEAAFGNSGLVLNMNLVVVVGVVVVLEQKAS